MMGRHRLLAGALATATWLAPALASALSASDAQTRAATSLKQVEGELGQIGAAAAKAAQRQRTPASRVADAELLVGIKDWDRAIDLLSQVIELHRQGKASVAAHADASFLLGEAYFKSGQLLSAELHFREILDKGATVPYDRFAGRSLGRLVDIAIQTGRLDGLDDLVARAARLSGADPTGSLPYARAKAYFAKRDLAAAKSAIASVPSSSAWAIQAQYLLGVILVREAAPAPGGDGAGQPTRYAAAVEQFRRVTRMSAPTAQQRHVVDLAWMAVGRLFYESDQFLDASEAYSHVDRTSPELGHMLYELAWVYVRLGDYQRAQRSLEVLSATDPDSREIADGTLLRADLMLRSGQFAEALALYESVRSRFEPIREQVATFLATSTDPAVYYDLLVDESAKEGSEKALPPLALRWAREEAEDSRAFAVIDDVARARDLVRRSRRLVVKLEGVLSGGGRVRAFPELQASLEAALALANRVALARMALAQGMDDVGSASPGGELGRVRAERRSLMKRLAMAPASDGDFRRRESQGEKQWNRVSQQVQRMSLEADRLQALINALERVMRDADKHGVTRDPESRRRFRAEIDDNKRLLEGFRSRINELRDRIDLGRSQVGFGDQRYVDDDRIRARFRQLFAREVELVAGGGDGGSAAEYARAIRPLLARADSLEARLEGTATELQRTAKQRGEKLLADVARESSAIEDYASKLEAMDLEARSAVGEVAMRNLALVRDRLKGVVLRADVGIVQQAWEVRETQRIRVRNLQRERAREELRLNDELREVLDDAEVQ
ncbi:MAG: tetratricopeptide repeat protein [Polyangiaceae bacterium]|nr:tetratricopeptide repeat protein [Polyangiaceae bacterium]